VVGSATDFSLVQWASAVPATSDASMANLLAARSNFLGVCGGADDLGLRSALHRSFSPGYQAGELKDSIPHLCISMLACLPRVFSIFRRLMFPGACDVVADWDRVRFLHHGSEDVSVQGIG